MTKGMRAPSTKTGFLLPLAEDRLARLLLAAAAVAREDATADRIVVLTPGFIMARLQRVSESNGEQQRHSGCDSKQKSGNCGSAAAQKTRFRGVCEIHEKKRGCVCDSSPVNAVPRKPERSIIIPHTYHTESTGLVRILLDDSG